MIPVSGRAAMRSVVVCIFFASLAGFAKADEWVPLGPPGITSNYGYVGHVNAIAMHPTDRMTLYIGTNSGGIWKSTNRGSTWESISDGQLVRERRAGGGLRGTQTIQSVVLHPNDPEIVLAGTGEDGVCAVTDQCGGGLGVFASVDGGKTWDPVGTDMTAGANAQMASATVFEIVIRGGINPEFFAATNTGLYRFAGAPASWSRVLDGVVMSLVETDGSLYAGIHGRGVFRVDVGASLTFTQITTGLPPASVTMGTERIAIGRIALAALPAFPRVLYVGLERIAFDSATGKKNRSFYTLLRTTDGTTWSDLTGPQDAQLYFNNTLTVDPRNPYVVYIGQQRLFRHDRTSLTDLTASATSGLLHADVHDVVFDPVSPHFFFVATDGGVTLGTDQEDGSVKWTPLNNGLTIGQCGTIGLAPRNPRASFCGLWHNGNAITSDGGKTWVAVGGGDGFQASIDTNLTSATVFVYFNQNAGPNGGVVAVAESPYYKYVDVMPNSGTTVALAADPFRPGQLLRTLDGSANGDLARTKTTGGIHTHEVIGPAGRSGNSKSVAFHRPASATEQPIYYLGTENGELWRGSKEAGWSKLIAATGRVLSAIAPDPHNSDRIYVVHDGRIADNSVRLVTRTCNASGGCLVGVNDIGGGLALVPLEIERILSVAADPVLTDTVYVGTDQGLYRGIRLAFGGWEWRRAHGIPEVWVTDLEMQQSIDGPSGIVRAGTWGRGVFELSRDASPVRYVTVQAIAPPSLEAPREIAVDIRLESGGATQGSVEMKTTPFFARFATGTRITLEAPAELTIDGRTLRFAGWEREHAPPDTERRISLVLDRDTPAVAIYEPLIPQTLLALDAYAVGEDGAPPSIRATVRVEQNGVGRDQQVPTELTLSPGTTLRVVAPASVTFEGKKLRFLAWVYPDGRIEAAPATTVVVTTPMRLSARYDDDDDLKPGGGESRKSWWSFHLGQNFPLGSFDEIYDPAASLTVDLERPLAENYSAYATLGHHYFHGNQKPDLTVTNLSLNLRRYFSGSSRPVFVQLGPGLYRVTGGSTFGGGNVGVGILFPITSSFGVELGTNLHALGSSHVRLFVDATLGIRFRF